MNRKLLPLFLLSSSIAAAQQPNIVMLFVEDLSPWSETPLCQDYHRYDGQNHNARLPCL